MAANFEKHSLKTVRGVDYINSIVHALQCKQAAKMTKFTRKSVHRTRMPPTSAIQKKGLYATVTGIP